MVMMMIMMVMRTIIVCYPLPQMEGGPPPVFDHQLALDVHSRMLYVVGGRVMNDSPNVVATEAGTEHLGIWRYDISAAIWTCLRCAGGGGVHEETFQHFRQSGNVVSCFFFFGTPKIIFFVHFPSILLRKGLSKVKNNRPKLTLGLRVSGRKQRIVQCVKPLRRLRD